MAASTTVGSSTQDADGGVDHGGVFNTGRGWRRRPRWGLQHRTRMAASTTVGSNRVPAAQRSLVAKANAADAAPRECAWESKSYVLATATMRLPKGICSPRHPWGAPDPSHHSSWAATRGAT